MTNSHLHIRNNYENFNCEHLIKELNELVKISVFVLKLENFVNLNLIGLRKILKKFDKKFEKVFGKISLKYLVKKLEGNNSDLLYILQFKMIDESSSILDDLLMEIESRFTEAFKILKNHKNKTNDTSIISTNTTSKSNENNILKANLLDNENSINSDELKTSIDINKTTSKYDLFTLFDSFVKIKRELQENLENIDMHSDLFSQSFNDWNDSFKFRLKYIISEGIRKKKKSTKIYSSLTEENENIIDSNRMKNSFRAQHNNQEKTIEKSDSDISSIYSTDSEEATKQIEDGFTTSQKMNIFFSYMDIILKNLSLYVCYATVGTHIEVKTLDGDSLINSTWILALTSLGYIIGTFIFSKIICLNFKFNNLVSLLILALGNFLYCIFNGKETLYFLALSRLVIGIGTFKDEDKNYLDEYIPDKLKHKYQERKSIIYLLSVALAFLTSTFCCFLKETQGVNFIFFEVNKFNLSSFVLAFLCILFFILNIFLFSNTDNPSFHVFTPLISENLLLSNRYKVKSDSKVNDKNNSDEISLSEKSANTKTYHTISREVLSKQEIEMIDDIESKLFQLNEQNQFTDTNLVQRTIKRIVYREKHSSGFFKKNFMLLFSLLIIARTLFESLLLISPIIGYEVSSERGNDLQHSLLFFIATAIITPISIFVKYSYINSGKQSEKTILAFTKIALLIVMFVSIGTWQIIQLLWICFFAMTFLIGLVQANTSLLLEKIVPMQFSFLCIKSNFVIPIFSAIGKFTAGIVSYGCCLLWGKGQHLVLGINALIEISSLILFFMFYKNFKVKAISKLIKQRKDLRD